MQFGDRSYGEEKEEVAKYGIEFMKELQKQGIISVIKHFPGHGAVNQDSHFFLPKIKMKMEQLEKEDMYPFEQAIKNGADSILMGHLIVKSETRELPASLSRKFITKYLRKKYHYRGLIITDDLKMKAIKFFYGTQKAVKKAFEAGNDVILFRISPDKQEQIINEIYDLVRQRDKQKIKRITNNNDSYDKLFRIIEDLADDSEKLEKVRDSLDSYIDKINIIGAYENEKFYKIRIINLILNCKKFPNWS